MRIEFHGIFVFDGVFQKGCFDSQKKTLPLLVVGCVIRRALKIVRKEEQR